MIEIDICKGIQPNTGTSPTCGNRCANEKDMAKYYTQSEFDALLTEKEDLVTKEYLLSLLGYDITPIEVTGCDGVVQTFSMLAKELPLNIQRTTLFSDGTLILNEEMIHRADDIAQHGNVAHEYLPGPYSMASSADQPWASERNSISDVIVDASMSPTTMAFWFADMSGLYSADLTGIQTENVTTIESLFANCEVLVNVDVTSFNTASLTNMQMAFYECNELVELDLRSFVCTVEMKQAFYGSNKLKTLYATNTLKPTNGGGGSANRMAFLGCFDIVGDHGTTYSSSSDATRAREDDPPLNKGYYTVDTPYQMLLEEQ